jgi:hypothetical protein
MFGGSYQGLNTTTTLVQICQNIWFSFSLLENTYLGLVQAGTSLVGLVMYWYIQRYWKIEPKKMARLLGCFFLKNAYFYGYLAHHDNHCGSLSPSLGNDRYWDGQAWVSRQNCSSPTGTGHS